jgi:hypothetical protein
MENTTTRLLVEENSSQILHYLALWKLHGFGGNANLQSENRVYFEAKTSLGEPRTFYSRGVISFMRRHAKIVRVRITLKSFAAS